MHEPGPPRTTSVGESVELAPRSPDPDGTYEWTLRDAPAESDARVDGQPVSGSSDDGELLVPARRADRTHRSSTSVPTPPERTS